MRDTFPNKINSNEVGIVNLDSIKNNSTHWVFYHRNKNKCLYFDSFGWIHRLIYKIIYVQTLNFQHYKYKNLIPITVDIIAYLY